MQEDAVPCRAIGRALRAAGVALCLFGGALTQALAGPPATDAQEEAVIEPSSAEPKGGEPSGHVAITPDPGRVTWLGASPPSPAVLGTAARRVGDNGLYAYLDLSPSMPWHMRKLLGKPEGGLTLERRPGNGLVGQLGLGSVMRWKLSDGGQLALRWRGGRMSLQYGLKFDL